MSTNIYGSVEIKMFDTGHDDWFGIIDVGIALPSDYDVFGCLFGIRNEANFSPLFHNRGIPPDCSEEVVEKYNDIEYYKNLTWCTYQELLEINLDEISVEPDNRILAKFESIKGLSTIKRRPGSNVENSLRKHISRREALDNPNLKQLMELMNVLSKRYGNEGVRMVVWFD